MNTKSKVIEKVLITGDAMVHIVIKNKTRDVSHYLPVNSLAELLHVEFMRIIDLPENKADKERYTRSLVRG